MYGGTRDLLTLSEQFLYFSQKARLDLGIAPNVIEGDPREECEKDRQGDDAKDKSSASKLIRVHLLCPQMVIDIHSELLSSRKARRKWPSN